MRRFICLTGAINLVLNLNIKDSYQRNRVLKESQLTAMKWSVRAPPEALGMVRKVFEATVLVNGSLATEAREAAPASIAVVWS